MISLLSKAFEMESAIFVVLLDGMTKTNHSFFSCGEGIDTLYEASCPIGERA